MVHTAEGRLIHDPNSKPQQVAAAAISAPAVSVKSHTTNVFTDCPTASIQSETFSWRAKIVEKPDAAQTAPTATAG